MYRLIIIIACMVFAFAFQGQSLANTDVEVWLPVSAYNLLDDTANKPVKPANTRLAWDSYALSITADTEQVQLHWQAQEEISLYRVEYRIGGGNWVSNNVTNNSFIVASSLTGNVEFRISGCLSESECISYSNELITVFSDTSNHQYLPSIITLPRYITYGEPFAIEWSEVESATSYELQRQYDNNTFESVFTGLPDKNNGNFEVRSMPLAQGDYCYRLRSQINNVYGEFSSPVCTTIGERSFEAPNGFTAQETDAGRYQISWQNVPHAASYKLEREGLSTINSVLSSIGSSNSVSSKSSNNMQSLAATDKQTTTSFSAVNSITSSIQTVTNTVTPQWQTVIEENVNSSEQVHTIDTFERDGLQKYRVSACNDQGDCGDAVELNYMVATHNVVDGVPTGVTAELQVGENALLVWNAVPGADTYVVNVHRKNSNWSRDYIGLTTTEMHYAFTKSGEYTFTVSACIDAGFCANKSHVSELIYIVDGTSIKTPSILEVSLTAENKVAIAWKAPETNDVVVEYEIQGELKNTIEKRTFSVGNDNFYRLERDVITERLAEGREYCYWVRAWFADGSVGEYTNTECITIGQLAFVAVENLQVQQIDTDSYKVSWDKVDDASHYLLEPQVSLGKWQAIQYSESTERVVQYNPFYKDIYEQLGHIAYRVSACDDKEYCGNYTRVYLSTVPDEAFLALTPEEDKVPACLHVPEHVNAGESIHVSWCQPETSGVESYELRGELKGLIASGSDDDFELSLQGLISVTRPSLTEGKEYCYEVRAKYSNGDVSDYIDKQCVTVGYIAFEAPEEMIFQASAENSNNFNVAWTPDVIADHYLLERQSSIGVWEAVNCQVNDITINTVNYHGCNLDLTSDDLLTELSLFSYRVSACNAENICGNYQRVNFQPPVIKQFEWVPNSIYIGQTTKFVWHIENVSKCQSDASEEHVPIGETQALTFYTIGTSTTAWHCTDLNGNRYPADITEFLTATLSTKKLPVPTNLTGQSNE